MGRMYRQDLIDEAERERLIQRAATTESHPLDRALLAVGTTLIDSGLRLYAWYQLRRLERDWARTHGLL
jgi:hypothetical protein